MSKRNSQLFRVILSAEQLEDRRLLTASGWGGFDPIPEINRYAVEVSQIEIDFSGNTDLDLVKIGDLNRDGKNDLVTVNSADSMPVLTVFYGNGHGSFEKGNSTVLETVSGNAAGILADVTGNGVMDYVSVEQDVLNGALLNVSVYTYSGGTFALAQSETISLAVFGSYSLYVVTSIRLAEVGGDLAIQIENSYGFDVSGNAHSLDGTAVCANNGSGVFSNPCLLPSFLGKVAGSITLNGIDYLVSLNNGTRTFGFWYYNASKTAWSTAGSIGYTADAGNISISSTTVSGSSIRFSGNVGGTTKIFDFSLQLSGGKVTLASSQGYELNRVYSSRTVLTDGDLNGDRYDDLMLVDAYHFTTLIGTADGAFSQDGTTIAQTDYLAVTVTDINGDGKDEILTVGAIGIWGVPLSDFEADPVQYACFDDAASAAVFGDFDGDGKIEAAVLESETNRIGIYDYAGGEFHRVQLVTAPVKTIDGQTVTAEAVNFCVGKFSVSARDQLLIQYQWNLSAGDRLVIYDAVIKDTVAELNLNDGESITALTAGNLYTKTGLDDFAAVVSTDSDSCTVVWKNVSGSLNRQTGILLRPENNGIVTQIAAGDLDGDGLGDLALLASETGSAVSLGLLTKKNGAFDASKLRWTSISASGSFDGLLLADITGDGYLDAVTTRTSFEDAGFGRSVIYMSKGTESGFDTLTAYPLGGSYMSGVPFDGTAISNPALTCFRNAETGLGDLILAKGRSVAVVSSTESGTGEEEFFYCVQASSSAKPVTIQSNPGGGSYLWVDEWSSFYVEIWGTANGAAVEEFKTTLTYNTSCFNAVSIESGNAFSASYSVENGACAVTGTSVSRTAPAAGSYVLLARILFKPVENGGVAIPNDGCFFAYNAGFDVKNGSESINGAYSAVSQRDYLTDLELFSVRLDSNDDGRIDVADFTLFANNYGLGVTGKPFKNAKAETFNVVAGNGLDVRDFTVFANAYGLTYQKITADRFYDRLGLNPTDWVKAAELPEHCEAVDELLSDEEPITDFAAELLANTVENTDTKSVPEAAEPVQSFLWIPEEENEKDWFFPVNG